MKRRLRIASIAAATFSVCGIAQAAVQADVAVLRSEFREFRDSLETGVGFKAGVEYVLEESPVFFQLNYLQSGDNDFIFPAGSPFEAFERFKGFTVSPGLRGVISPASGSAVWIKGNFYQGKSTVEFKDSSDPSNNSSNSKSGTGFGFGFGVDWRVTRKVALRLDYEALLNVKVDFSDPSEPNLIIPQDLTLLGLGVVYSFGGTKSAAPSHKARPAPVPPAPLAAATAPPAEAPEPVQVPVPVPPPPPAPEFFAGQTGMAMPGAILRSRPAADGGSISALNSGEPVLLRSEVKNAAGDWWYGEAAGQRGWIRETDLQPKMP